MNLKKDSFLMLNPSIMEIEEKSEINTFWKSEWKRVKNDISNFKSLIKYIFEIR